MFFSLSRLSALDIKWADQFDANSPSFRWKHNNPYNELIAVVDGPVYLETEGNRYTLRAGECLLLLPWEQHTGWNLGLPQGSFFWVQFSTSPAITPFVTESTPELNIVHAESTELRTAEASHEDILILPRTYLPRQRFQILQLFEQLVGVSRAPKGYFRFHQTLLLGELLRLLATDFLERHQPDTTFPVSYVTFRKLVNYLNNHFDKQISKERMERSIERTYEYMCQVFKKYADTTIVQYVNRLRVQKARHLLLDTDLKISEIAEEVGFQDAFYFSRIFKRLEGDSPQHFRDRQESRKFKEKPE